MKNCSPTSMIMPKPGPYFSQPFEIQTTNSTFQDFNISVEYLIDEKLEYFFEGYRLLRRERGKIISFVFERIP